MKRKKTAEEITELSDSQKISQGKMVAQVLDMPGWILIENCIRLTKNEAEQERRRKLRNAPTRELSLYYDGMVDGAEMTWDKIEDLILKAKQIEKDRENPNLQMEA